MSAPAFPAIQAIRNATWANGYRPMAVYSWDYQDPPPLPGKKPKKKAGKVPLGLGWEKRARQTPPECITLASVVAQATNTGILADGLRAIDLDLDEQPLVALCHRLALDMLGATILRTRDNSPRCLLVYRASDGEPPKRVITGASHSDVPGAAWACKIEVLGRGQQFVAYGKHPSGAELQWLAGGPADVALADLPAVSEAQVTAFLDAAAEVIDALPVKPEKPKRERTRDGKGQDGLPAGDTFFDRVNTGALADIEAWAEEVFPTAVYQETTGAYRITSAALGRNLEEDLSIHPDGVFDFGLERGMTPIGVVVAHHPEAPDPTEAAFWLCRRLGLDPVALGWVDPEEIAAATQAKTAEAARRKSTSANFVGKPQEGDTGNTGGGGQEPPREPPPGWQTARPVLGEDPVLLLADLSKPRRPNTTMAELRTKMRAGTVAWIAGEGPAHLVNSFATGVQKNRIPISLLAEVARVKREARKTFMWAYRLQHRDQDGKPPSYARVAQAADDAGYQLLRVACVTADHGLAKQHADLARSLGMIVAVDAGYDRTVEPSDPTSPPLCTQKDRAKQSRRAGDSVRLTACGDLDHAHCVDRIGCRKHQMINDVAHAEFVTMMPERLTGHHVSHELRGWDFVLIDEPPDRVFLIEKEFELDLLDDHLLRDRAPVLRKDGDDYVIDEAATEEASTVNAIVRAGLDARSNGYWDRDAMDAAGCTAALFERFVDLSHKRDRPSGMTAATSDHERESIARNSFSNAIRRMCGFGRLAIAVQAGEEGEGKLELDGDTSRIALMRPRQTLNPVFASARIMVTGAKLNTDDIRQWLPDAQPMDGADGIPEAQHQTLVHMHFGMGSRALENEQRQRFAKAFVKLEADTSRKDATGVSILKAHEEMFAGIFGIVTCHPGATVGRNDWMNSTTFINFGSRFLSPPDAAALGATATGEKVPTKRAVRQYRRVALKGGGDVALPIMEYEHPAAAAANHRVRDFDIMQGPLARPRAADRTAATHVTTVDISTAAPDGCEFDVVITGWEQYAPERMVIAFAERGFITEHSLGRHVLHPKVYLKPWTGQNDQRLETDGFKATVLRMLVPAWRDGPNEPCVIGHLWRSGHAFRVEGEMFVCTQRAFAAFKAEATAKYGATRFKIDQKLWPYRDLTTVEELTITVEREENGAVSSVIETNLPGMPPGGGDASYRAEHPPDG